MYNKKVKFRSEKQFSNSNYLVDVDPNNLCLLQICNFVKILRNTQKHKIQISFMSVRHTVLMTKCIGSVSDDLKIQICKLETII